MPTPILDLKVVRDPPRVVCVSIAPEVDAGNVRAVEEYFEKMLDKEKPRDVLLDLSGLVFGCSGFLGCLVYWKEEVRKKAGGSLILFGLRSELASILRLTALDRHLTIRPDQQGALEAVSA